jgi:hypothetical protein
MADVICLEEVVEVLIAEGLAGPEVEEVELEALALGIFLVE